MEENRLSVIRGYLERLQLSHYVSSYTKVSRDWRFLDILPDYNRLYYIREGEGRIIIRGVEYEPRPGQLFLLPAGVRQSFYVVNDNTFRKYWCHFNATVGEMHVHQLLELPPYVEVTDHAEMERKFAELIHWYHDPSLAAPVRIKAILYEIYAVFLEQAKLIRVQPGESSGVGKIHTILDYIEQHLADQMTIEELARLAHFHPNYFMQLFKSVLGISPIGYINKKRMEKAQQLLAGTPLSIAEVADSIGLEPYYFSRLFKKWTGISPSEYRRYGGKP